MEPPLPVLVGESDEEKLRKQARKIAMARHYYTVFMAVFFTLAALTFCLYLVHRWRLGKPNTQYWDKLGFQVVVATFCWIRLYISGRKSLNS